MQQVHFYLGCPSVWVQLPVLPLMNLLVVSLVWLCQSIMGRHHCWLCFSVPEMHSYGYPSIEKEHPTSGVSWDWMLDQTWKEWIGLSCLSCLEMNVVLAYLKVLAFSWLLLLSWDQVVLLVECIFYQRSYNILTSLCINQIVFHKELNFSRTEQFFLLNTSFRQSSWLGFIWCMGKYCSPQDTHIWWCM